MLFTVYIACALTVHLEQSTTCNYSAMPGGIIAFKQKSWAVSLSLNIIKCKSARYVWTVSKGKGAYPRKWEKHCRNITEGILNRLD